MNHSRSDRFVTTNWSLVLAAMDTAPACAFDALARLCSRYWFPVYAAIRRHGHGVHEAEDLTQGFFEFAIEHQLLQRAQRDKGRFRNFLLGSIKNYLHNKHDHATAAKRGGKHQIIPIDEVAAEEMLANEPASAGAAENSFDRRWAITLIRNVMVNLRAEFAARGRLPVHDLLIAHLTGEIPRDTYDQMSADLGMTTGALEVALVRLRRRFGELLRSEVAHTVSDPQEVDEEIRYLLSVMTSG